MVGSKIDSKIAEFTQAFLDLRRQFTERGVLAIEVKFAVLDDIRTSSMLFKAPVLTVLSRHDC